VNSAFQHRYVISGRIIDPHGLRPADAMLSLGYDRDGVGYGAAVPVTVTGEFVTQVVYPGTYVLMLVRTPYSTTHPPMPVGLTLVEVGNQDLTGVTVTVERDTEARGRIRLARGRRLPPALYLSACLARDGVRRAACRPAAVASDGTVVLRNAFGPRLLESSHPIRVLLDGTDITRVPADFSRLGKANLEIVL
jgi:hypothetical protein